MTNIPQQVDNIAHEHALNSIEYICTYENIEYYGLGLVDSSGFQLPIGLPIIVKGNNSIGYEFIHGEEGFSTLKKLNKLGLLSGE